MRNRYPEACSICQGTVPAGEGTLRREGSGWSVTHTDACPRGIPDNGSVRHGHARAFTKRVLSPLRRADATIDEIEEVVVGLAALVRTRWTSIETCERILLGSPAVAAMDRLKAEEILSQLVLEDSHT